MEIIKMSLLEQATKLAIGEGPDLRLTRTMWTLIEWGAEHCYRIGLDLMHIR